MKHAFIFALISILILSPWCRAAEPSPVETSFKTVIQPFLANHCIKCHGPEKKKGGIRLDDLQADVAAKGDTDRWRLVLAQIESGEMPPKAEAKPSVEAKANVSRWILAALHRAGNDPSFERAFPGKGNYIPHELLFGDKAPKDKGTEAAPTARIWRLRPEAYHLRLLGLSSGSVGDVPLPDPRRPGNDPGAGKPPIFLKPTDLTSEPEIRDYAFRYTVTGAEIEQMVINANVAIHRLLSQSDLPKNHSLVKLYAGKTSPTPELISTAVTLVFRRAMFRDPTAEELGRYSAFTKKCVDKLGTSAGLKMGLAPILVHPEFLFRTELGSGSAKRDGVVLLNRLELAQAITNAFTDRPPDKKLLEAVAQNRLDTREDVAHEVERILNDDQYTKTRIRDFFREYFGYAKAVDVFKDPSEQKKYGILGGWKPEAAVQNSDALVALILKEDRDVLTRLLTFPTPSGGYRVPLKKGQLKKSDQQKEPEKPAAASPKQPNVLTGILMQPAWLAAYSTNFDNNAILRGRWIRERLLGGLVPDVPITVDAQLPDEPDKPLRERMRVTRAEYCWKCHVRMDPLGLTFENFNHFGNLVSDRNKTNKNAKPVAIDTSGDVVNSGDPALDGPVKNAEELIRRLAKSERVQQVFVRHAFRYWMGRNETLNDAPILQAAYRDYKESGGSMKALIKSLLTSDAFLYRRIENQPASVNPSPKK